MINETYLLYGLLAANAAMLLIAWVALLQINARCRRLEEFKLHAASALPAASPTTNTNASDDEKSFEKLERRLELMRQSILMLTAKTPEKRLPEVRSLPIENAVRMAKKGATIDELTRNCGLNIGEAQLMKKLHSNAKSAALRN